MSESKFTPGPWRSTYDFATGSHMVTSSDGLIALVQSDNPEADRCMIAASPVLYNVLEDAALQIEYFHERFRSTGSGATVLRTIRLALAAARGEKP